MTTVWEGSPSYPGDTNVIFFDLASVPDPTEDDFVEVATATIDETASFPYTGMTIPASAFKAEGSYTFRYRVLLVNGSTDISLPVPLRIDRIPPYGAAPDGPDPIAMILPTEPINDAYLTANGNVTGTIPSYPDWQLGDMVTYYWGKFPLPEDITTVDPVGHVAITEVPFSVTFDEATIRNVGDGGCFALYILWDKAGNRSDLSFTTSVGVALGDYPTLFLPPEVPAAADGLVDLKDVIDQAGLDVLIPHFDNAKPTDFIELTWGDSVMAKEEIGSMPLPRTLKVPPEVLKAQYADALGAIPTNVSYRVLRGTVEMGTQQTSVDVDFSVVGPVNPDPWPDPINPLLLAPDVQGQGDTAELNKLNRDDTGLPANLTFSFPDGLVAGDDIVFYWGATEVTAAQYTVTGEEAEEDPLTVVIPWEIILEAGNSPAMPVHYRIRGQDSTNEQHSIHQTVIVDAIQLIPDAPEFLGAAGDWLNCESLYDLDNSNSLEPAIRVQVPDLSKWLTAGDTVTMKWVALPTRNPTELTPIPGASLEEDVVLDNTTVKGFVWYVQPYGTHILPTYDPDGPGTNSGRGQASYHFTYQSEAISSLAAQKYVGMFDGSGSCPIPPVR